jgi:hypothetical protein
MNNANTYLVRLIKPVRYALCFIWYFSAIVTASAQTCPNQTSIADLTSNLQTAETAFTAMDVEQFSRALEDLALKVPCVREPLIPTLAARFHRVTGIRLYASANEIQAFQALQAAKVLDPDFLFPEGMFPPGHDLVEHYNSLSTKERVEGRIPAPRNMSVLFDGIATRKKPAGRATLLQFTSKDGVVRSTQFLNPGDPLPQYEARPPIRKPILIGTLVAAGIATGLYGGALLSKAEFNRENSRLDMDQLEGLRKRTNSLVALSGIFAGLSIGGGITIIVVGDR